MSPSTNKIEYVTTAIVYPNARIHVGWAWECLGADWLVRSMRLMGRQTFFATGMDEHSINVQRAAEARGLTPKAYCDEMATETTRVLRQMGMSYDRFIRTSDEDHEWVVQQLVKRAFDSGDVYKGRYEGYYCESCEAFYTEKDLVNGLCPQHQGKGAPKWLVEENYFFKLSKYQDRLLQLLESNPQFLQPDYRRAEIINFVKAGLKDFSISRSTFKWGVPLPFDSEHIVYVWFDALINYLTAAGMEFKIKDPSSSEAKAFDARWPANVHIIGKDISRFHAIYWPAMLWSVGVELPKQVFVHGFLQIKGDRMSKSSGNVVDPAAVLGWAGPDPFRYYLLAENQFSGDGNYADDLLILKCNADLSNDLGNLVNRSISMTRKYFPGEKISAPAQATHSAEIRATFEALRGELERAIEARDPSGYIAACMARSRALNLYIDRTKPWALAKDPAKADELREVLFTLLEGIRWLSVALMPVLPFGMPQVQTQLGFDPLAEQGAYDTLKWGSVAHQPGEPKPVYMRLEAKAEASSDTAKG